MGKAFIQMVLGLVLFVTQSGISLNATSRFFSSVQAASRHVIQPFFLLIIFNNSTSWSPVLMNSPVLIHKKNNVVQAGHEIIFKNRNNRGCNT